MIPKYLTLKNFLSHDHSEIDFDKFDVALILGAFDGEADQSNGSGKSSIFEAISWALFGKSRHKKKNGVIKWDKRGCEVEFDFWMGDSLYKIKRTRDKVIGDSDVGFMLWDGAQFQDISCDTRTATDAKIAKTISVNYDVFINSVYFKQNDISMFTESTPSKRKDILKSLLRIDKWDEYQKKARDKARTFSSKADSISVNLISIEKIDEEMEECNLLTNQLRNKVKNNNQQYTAINSKLVSLKLELNTIKNVNVDEELKRLEKEHKQNQLRFNEIKTKRELNNKNIINGSNQISDIQQKMRTLREKIKEAKDIDIVSLRYKAFGGEAKAKMIREKILDLEKKLDLDGNQCNVCEKPLTKKEVTTIVQRRESKLAELKSKHTNLKEKLARANKKLDEKETIVKDGNKAEIDKGKCDIRLLKFRNMIKECESSNERLDKEEKSLQSINLVPEIENLQKLVNNNGVARLKKSISDCESKLSSIKSNGDKLNFEYGTKVQRHKELKNIREEQVKLKKDVDKAKETHALYDKLRLYFGKDGVQSVIIENVIEELENYSNDLLLKICNDPMSVSIKTQKQNENGSWAETFDIEVTSGARTDDLETYSGGEKFRVSLALRLALSNILATRMGGVLNFLLLDEVSSSLDNKGIDMFIEIVKNLSRDMKVLIITHDEKLKDKFDNIIMVNKGPNGSRAELR